MEPHLSHLQNASGVGIRQLIRPLVLHQKNYPVGIKQRLLDIHHLCAGMKPQAVQRVAKLLVPPRAQKYGILLPVIHQQGLQHLDGTHLVMQHQAMEVPLPAHVKIDGMKHLKQKEILRDMAVDGLRLLVQIEVVIPLHSCSDTWQNTHWYTSYEHGNSDTRSYHEHDS
ncbi:hypothetical protein LUU34_00787500 [Aix galericulata]|nr:hypothetical protein LUU34_00787500 [Aix galericulata]